MKGINMNIRITENAFYTLEAGEALVYRTGGTTETEIPIRWPVFEIDGRMTGVPSNLHETGRRMCNEDIEEITLEGSLGGGLTLGMVFRVCAKTPFVRFRYILSSSSPAHITKTAGESLCYLSYPAERDAARTEIRFSTYDSLLHGYCLDEIPAFAHEDDLMGPILTECRGEIAMLTAYEHGSMYPEKFVVFRRTANGIALEAYRGNYRNGQAIDGEPYETIWLQMGAVEGTEDDLARSYREFQLSYCTLNRESRKPHIFYNTWAFQERNRFWGKKEYLTSMNQERMEREIEIAHRMGVDVFVLDTGWYEKTGDWETNRRFFPDGMEHIRDLLEARGMKLGLWFGPTSAAVSSAVLQKNTNCKASTDGREPQPYRVWETEESYSMCLVSDYWKDFADRLIELAKTVGVRYFKWDAVDTDGCDCAGHRHGDENDPREERRASFRFQIGQYMSKVVDRLCEAVPDAIVDMDITEGRRYFGLGFLSSGKFFSLNNGPYYGCYNVPIPDFVWSNIFVYPGPARTWVCRQNLAYDKWIPSVLMMAHYLPDDPAGSQLLNLASLVLGQNGIWGDLLNVSEEGQKLFGEVLGVYKRVRDDVTAAYPTVYGRPGETFEVHEKINAKNGRGLVSLFANQSGTYRYCLSSNVKGKTTVFGPAVFRQEDDGAWIEAEFPDAGAAIVFFE